LRRFRVAGFRIRGALVSERDQQSLVQEGKFTQALCQGVEVIFGYSENALIGQEVNLRPPLRLHLAGFFQLAGRLALRIRLLPGKTIAPDLQVQFFAERVHTGNANAVQSAGNFVRRCIELAAGMERGHDHLSRRNFFSVDVHRIDGNAAAVIHDSDGIIDMNCDINLVGVSGERFINRIVYDFIDQMVQANLARRADVHGRTFTHGLHATQHFDGIRCVIAVT